MSRKVVCLMFVSLMASQCWGSGGRNAQKLAQEIIDAIKKEIQRLTENHKASSSSAGCVAKAIADKVTESMNDPSIKKFVEHSAKILDEKYARDCVKKRIVRDLEGNCGDPGVKYWSAVDGPIDKAFQSRVKGYAEAVQTELEKTTIYSSQVTDMSKQLDASAMESVRVRTKLDVDGNTPFSVKWNDNISLIIERAFKNRQKAHAEKIAKAVRSSTYDLDGAKTNELAKQLDQSVHAAVQDMVNNPMKHLQKTHPHTEAIRRVVDDRLKLYENHILRSLAQLSRPELEEKFRNAERNQEEEPVQPPTASNSKLTTIMLWTNAAVTVILVIVIIMLSVKLLALETYVMFEDDLAEPEPKDAPHDNAVAPAQAAANDLEMGDQDEDCADAQA